MKHTPGPWHYGAHSGKERGDGSGWGAEGLWTADNRLILGMGDGWDREYEGPRNAADKLLIAAAPRLAAALKQCVSAISQAPVATFGHDPHGWPYADELLDEARAALREAGVDGA